MNESELTIEQREEQLCDRIVAWADDYFKTLGIRFTKMRFVLINRRWGQQLRAFARPGEGAREVLQRDCRFTFTIVEGGGYEVGIATGEGSRAEVRAARDRLFNFKASTPVPVGPAEPEVSEDVRRLAELMSDPEA